MTGHETAELIRTAQLGELADLLVRDGSLPESMRKYVTAQMEEKPDAYWEYWDKPVYLPNIITHELRSMPDEWTARLI